jgi:hypothetical protein
VNEKSFQPLVGATLVVALDAVITVHEVILERETRESSAKNRENQNFAFFRVFFAPFAFKIPRSSAAGKSAEGKKPVSKRDMRDKKDFLDNGGCSLTITDYPFCPQSPLCPLLNQKKLSLYVSRKVAEAKKPVSKRDMRDKKDFLDNGGRSLTITDYPFCPQSLLCPLLNLKKSFSAVAESLRKAESRFQQLLKVCGRRKVVFSSC